MTIQTMPLVFTILLLYLLYSLCNYFTPTAVTDVKLYQFKFLNCVKCCPTGFVIALISFDFCDNPKMAFSIYCTQNVFAVLTLYLLYSCCIYCTLTVLTVLTLYLL